MDDVKCVECGAAVAWLDRMQVYVPATDSLIYPICRPCFERLTAPARTLSGGAT